MARSFMASKGLSDKELVLFQSSNPTALRAQSVDAPAYHIFTDTDKKEFIVVSGDDIARPILGYH
ncbi:MAG: Spi family protease inhibitor [Bacteroidaceae bacterium]|nr:Spi family protease inhibitor [Bacteroidaceae bacterium]